MKEYTFKVRLCGGYESDGNVVVEAENEDIAYDMALNYVCDKLADALPELGIDVTVELEEDIYE